MNRRSRFLVLAPAVAALGLAACEFKVSTANISDAKLARSVDAQMQAVDPTTVFSSSDSAIHTVVNLANAPENTLVRSIWRDSTGVELVRSDMNAGGNLGVVHFTFRGQGGFDPGRYSNEIYLDPLASDSGTAPDRTLEFTVR